MKINGRDGIYIFGEKRSAPFLNNHQLNKGHLPPFGEFPSLPFLRNVF